MKKNNEHIVWIIEDEYYDYSIIRKTLQSKGYTVFPDFATDKDFKPYRGKLLGFINDRKLKDFVKESMSKNSFSALVCDIRLGEDDKNSGEEITKIIRLNSLNHNLLVNSFPIFIMTKFANTGKEAIKYGAFYSRKYFESNYNINSNQEEIFLTRLKYRIDEFENDNRIKEILKPSFLEYQNIMIKHNKIIEAQIDDIKVIFQNSNENTLSEFNSSFGLLLKLSLEQLKHINREAYEDFANKFDNELINEIGQEPYDHLMNEINKVKSTGGGSFKELLKNGSIEDAVSFLGNTFAIPSGGITSLVAFSISLLIKNFK